MAQPPQPKIQYVDRPELNETFVDSVRNVTFDGATVRAELCVTRFDEPASTAAAAGRQSPVSRVVLRPDAAVDLFMRLQRLLAFMEQRGIIKREAPPQAAAGTPGEALANPL